MDTIKELDEAIKQIDQAVKDLNPHAHQGLAIHHLTRIGMKLEMLKRNLEGPKQVTKSLPKKEDSIDEYRKLFEKEMEKPLPKNDLLPWWQKGYSPNGPGLPGFPPFVIPYGPYEGKWLKPIDGATLGGPFYTLSQNDDKQT